MPRAHSAAVGELRVVGEDGADAGEDCVGGVAEELHLVTRSGAGEPEGLVGSACGGRRSEFAVDGECGFEGDEGSSMLDEVSEGVVQVAGWLLEDAEADFDIGIAKFLNALAADQGVGVLGGDDAAGDAGVDEGVGAGRGAAVVAAGLEGDVGGGALGGDAAVGRLFEGYDLGVIAVVVEVGAFADDPWCGAVGGRLGKDTTYLGVRGGEADGFGGEVKGSLHEDFVMAVGRLVRHGVEWLIARFCVDGYPSPWDIWLKYFD